MLWLTSCPILKISKPPYIDISVLIILKLKYYIRNNKVKQKVTGGFRTESGAEDFAKTSSIVGTVVKFGDSFADTVKAIFCGNFTHFA
ncbi:hypothetical protein FACS1894167_13650 [Synergistales bacterium]|nr:hypothetical protein FACS1894167_13650 [Synergistales bacterium]